MMLLEMSFWKNLPSHWAHVSKQEFIPGLGKILTE